MKKFNPTKTPIWIKNHKGTIFIIFPYLKEKKEILIEGKSDQTKTAIFCKYTVIPQIEYLFTKNKEMEIEKHFQDCVKTRNNQAYDFDFHLINWKGLFKKNEINNEIKQILNAEWQDYRKEKTDYSFNQQKIEYQKHKNEYSKKLKDWWENKTNKDYKTNFPHRKR